MTVVPLVAGTQTLYFRDVINTHYPLKSAQALLQDGRIPLVSVPLVDPTRGAGQPLLGNPNAVPVYPTNLLYRWADPLWALNAHLWIHWLVAPLCGFWFARTWGLSSRASWATGVAWATSGFLLSQLNLYNMMAGVSLTPALVAAYVRLARSRCHHRSAATAGLLTGLVFLGGDPLTAVMAYLLAATAWMVAMGPPWTRGRAVLGSAAKAALSASLGALLAAPVAVEMLRILPRSYRGYWGYDGALALNQSWHPALLMDWWIPGFFGRIDLSYWGQLFSDGHPPLFSSLSPGWIVVALVVAAGVPRSRPARWAWGAVGLGGFLALGAHNPLLVAATSSADLAMFRYPVKAWLAVALGLSLLAGLGFESIERGRRSTAFLATLASALLLTLGGRGLLDPDSRLVEQFTNWAPDRLVGSFLEAEITRWKSSLLVSSLIVFAALLIALLSRRRPRFLSLLLVLHTIAQLHLLSALLDTDVSAAYVLPPPTLEHVPVGSDVVHGGFDEQFGARAPATHDPSMIWWSRTSVFELAPTAGVRHGLRYPFTRSPEGLDSFLAVAVAQVLKSLDDTQRLQILEAAGVEILILHRRLETEAAARAELVTEIPSLGRLLRVYRLPERADAINLVSAVRPAESLNAAVAHLIDPDFDARREVVLPARAVAAPDASEPSPVGDAGARESTLTIRADAVEEILVGVDATEKSTLVLQRAWLPIWKATVDGSPAKIEVANGFQMAVAVPPGRHEVAVYVDRGPTRWAWTGFGLAVTTILVLWTWSRSGGLGRRPDRSYPSGV